MVRGDVATGGAFLVLGAGLLASGTLLPAGVGGLPGAGFFPQAIGLLMAALAVSLAIRGIRRSATSDTNGGDLRAVAVIAALLFAYLALWGTGFFLVRTAVFVLLALRFLGQRWLPSLAFSAALVAFVHIAFDAGLNVSLQ